MDESNPICRASSDGDCPPLDRATGPRLRGRGGGSRVGPRDPRHSRSTGAPRRARRQCHQCGGDPQCLVSPGPAPERGSVRRARRCAASSGQTVSVTGSTERSTRSSSPASCTTPRRSPMQLAGRVREGRPVRSSGASSGISPGGSSSASRERRWPLDKHRSIHSGGIRPMASWFPFGHGPRIRVSDPLSERHQGAAHRAAFLMWFCARRNASVQWPPRPTNPSSPCDVDVVAPAGGGYADARDGPDHLLRSSSVRVVACGRGPQGVGAMA